MIFIDESSGVTISNIDVDAGTVSIAGHPKGGFYFANGYNLTLTSMRIHGFGLNNDNMNGLFADDADLRGTFDLENMEFFENGGSADPDHNVYIGWSATDQNFTVKLLNSWSHEAYYGHLFKTRAQYNILEGNYFQGGLPENGQTQSETFDVDIPYGGHIMIKDNIFVKNMSGPNSNAMSFAFKMDTTQPPDNRTNSIDIENNTFVALARTYDGSHPLYPLVFNTGWPNPTIVIPGDPGFPDPNPTIQNNAYVGYCPQGNRINDYRGLSATEGFSELLQQYSITNKFYSPQTTIIGTPTYSHAAQTGAPRAATTVGAQD